MSTLMLRGLEFELEKLDIDIVVTPKFISVTVSAIEAGDEGAHNRLFAHTHLTDLDLESPPEGVGDALSDAIAAFKEALSEQGGWIMEEEGVE
ncbi:hypothetical protein G7068_15995 [Leucobacter viscericola]|uniref:Uncharacterized protein n=1 Tax=Leucobacter viscericola TaxID=2714935 RepID=A0A6G7XJJ7_9MICO|nr:hypothetical protein [Leucobacter viscericola]QIK64548.1 hypothetical protein G7068_15995 [Leucobacter viscericola]